MTDDKATIAALRSKLEEALVTIRVVHEHGPWWAATARDFINSAIVLIAATEAESAAFVERVRAEALSDAAFDEHVALVDLLNGDRDDPAALAALAKHDAEVRAAALESVAAHLESKPHHVCRDGQMISFGQIAADTVRSFAQVHPPGQVGPPDDISQRVADALERSKPLVREALKLGRSIAGPDASLADVVIASGAVPVCATCGGEKVVRNNHTPRLDDPEWWPCPDCARGGR